MTILMKVLLCSSLLVLLILLSLIMSANFRKLFMG
jgi:hypothetical protein